MEMIERYRGALLGLAVGDALGAPLEFRPLGWFEPIRDMVAADDRGLQPGQWTDDTAMALCLADSLIACGGFDPIDQLRRYVRWYRKGYMSCTGHLYDIGNTVRAALHRFERTGAPYCGSSEPMTAGNGSLMRLAPIALFYARDPRQAVARAAESSRTTHQAPAAVDACRYFAGLLVGALRGEPKATLLTPRYTPVPGLWDAQPLAPEVDAVAAGSFRRREPPAIRGSGYVVESLEAALWAFDRSESFEEGALLAVNLGDDADTTGAILGQLAGAFYGERSIHERWLACLAWTDFIADLAERLHALAWPAAGTGLADAQPE